MFRVCTVTYYPLPNFDMFDTHKYQVQGPKLVGDVKLPIMPDCSPKGCTVCQNFAEEFTYT